MTVPWELRTGEVPAAQQRACVLSTAAYEAWVICWPPGVEVAAHDHGGSAGAFSIVSGELSEEAGDGPFDLQAVGRRHAAGATVSFAASQRLVLANRSAAPTTTVHVYSPPLHGAAPGDCECSEPDAAAERGATGDRSGRR